MNAFLDLSNCALKDIKHFDGEHDLTTVRGRDLYFQGNWSINASKCLLLWSALLDTSLPSSARRELINLDKEVITSVYDNAKTDLPTW